MILDGQGYQVSSSGSGTGPSVGIWVRLTDPAGKPVTGVSIRNVSIDDEDCGMYVEGADTSEFAWGSDRSGDPGMPALLSSPRSLMFTGINITNCGDGIRLKTHPDVLISDLRVVDSSGSGIVIDGSVARVVNSLISDSQKDGIGIFGSRAGEISSCTINGSSDAGIRLDNVSDFRIFNNILQNRVNLEVGPDSRGILLQTDRKDETNIIGGRILGGNFWISEDPNIPGSNSLPDTDGDGIGDEPYNPGSGLVDALPLVMPRAYQVQTIVPQTQPAPHQTVPTTTPVPVQTPLSFISGFHAAIVGDSIPQEMKPGKEYQVSLHLCNDGSDDWIAEHRVGIKAVDDTALYGPEWIPAPGGGPVHPGNVLTVNFSLRSPSVPGVYTLKYQAAREGSGVEVLFGRPYTKTVTVS